MNSIMQMQEYMRDEEEIRYEEALLNDETDLFDPYYLPEDLYNPCTAFDPVIPFDYSIGTNFIVANHYLFDDDTEVIKEPYNSYRYVLTNKNEDNVLTFEIHYYDWNTWLPENRDCKVVGCLSYDVLDSINQGFWFTKGYLPNSIFKDICEYGENKKKLNEVMNHKNIPNELEKVILCYMGYLNFYK